MYDNRYSTTRCLTEKKPSCFDMQREGVKSQARMPDSDQKVAEGGLRLQGLYKYGSVHNPLISIVTVVYNGEESIEKTIQSVLKQKYRNVEYIIIDGGSKDNTLDIIRRYEHAIDYWVSEPDNGLYYAMNKGIELGGGEWINFMNSGDSFFDALTLEALTLPGDRECSLVYGDKLQGGSLIKALPITRLEDGVIHACHQSMFFNLPILKSNNIMYNTRYKIYSDYDFVVKVYSVGRFFKYIERPVSIFEGGGLSSKVSWRKRFDKYHSIAANFGVLHVLNVLVGRFKKN